MSAISARLRTRAARRSAYAPAFAGRKAFLASQFDTSIGSTVIAIIVSLWATAPALAQADVARLPAITVKGNASPDEQAKARIETARETVAQRAGGTAVVDAQDYRDGRASNLADVMAYAPGVYTQTRHGEETRFSMRGSGIQRGFLLRGIHLYQDGVPLNHADGAGDFQSIDPLATQYVEVWRGANALEFGGNILGGAVNFVSPTGHSASPVSLRAQTGAFGHRQGQAAFAGATDRLDGYLSVSHSEQDGYRDHSGTRATRFSGNAGLVISPTWQARLYLTHIDSELQMPGSITNAAMQANRRQAAPSYAELDARNNYRMNRAALKVAWTPSDAMTWTTSMYVADRDRFHPMVYGILDQTSRDTGLDTRGVFNLSESTLTRRLVIGASFMRYRGGARSYANLRGSTGAQTRGNALTGRQYSLYSEYSHGLTESWILQAGAQAVRAERDLRNLLVPASGYSKDFTASAPNLASSIAIRSIRRRTPISAEVSRPRRSVS